MDINSKKQSQFELFPASSSATDVYEKSRYPFSIRNLTVSLENIVVVAISFVMIIVLFYAFGIERGKRAVIAQDAQAEKKTGNFSENAIIVISSEEKLDKESTEVIEKVKQQKVVEEKIEVIEIPKYEYQPQIVQDHFTIQVASFQLDRSARQEASTLKKKGYEISVLRKGKYSIVCVGKFDQRNDATKYSSKLKKRYKDLMVRRL